VKLHRLLELAIFTVPHVYDTAFAKRNQNVAQIQQKNNLGVVLLHFEFDSPPVPRIYVASNSSKGKVTACSKRPNFLGNSIR
jgi:hypothetical protein